jgi:hypothetical protein
MIYSFKRFNPSFLRSSHALAAGPGTLLIPLKGLWIQLCCELGYYKEHDQYRPIHISTVAVVAG